MMVSGRAKTRNRPLLSLGADGRNRDAEWRPGSGHHDVLARNVRGRKDRGGLGSEASTSRAMPHMRTLAEFEHDGHAVASLGLALMDGSLLALDSVIRKQGCGGLSHLPLNVAHQQQVSQAGRTRALRSASTASRQKQPSIWSLTRPMACMKA